MYRWFLCIMFKYRNKNAHIKNQQLMIQHQEHLQKLQGRSLSLMVMGSFLHCSAS